MLSLLGYLIYFSHAVWLIIITSVLVNRDGIGEPKFYFACVALFLVHSYLFFF